MKTRSLIQTLALSVLVSLSANAAQVTFNSFTTGPSAATGIISDPNNNPLASGNYSAQLWGSVAGNNPANFVQISGTYSFAVSGSSPSLFGGAVLDSSYDVPGSTFPATGSGNTFFYEVRAWDNTTGASFDAATVRAKSIVTSVVLGKAQNDLPPNTDNFQNFKLTAVPEPSVLALGVMGGLVLLFRRKK
jgi:hypothetical protein